jgi:type IV pilus assembly protein PilY1
MPIPSGNVSHKYQGAELFFELYRYLSGQGIWSGHVGFLDYQSNDRKNLDFDSPALDWDAGIESGSNYITPLSKLASCSKLFTVNFMFQVSQQDSNSNTEIAKTIANGGFGVNPGNSDTFRNVVEWLNDSDLADGMHGTVPDIDGVQNITSYFIVDPTKINQTTTGYSRAGGTGIPLSLSGNPQDLIDTLTEILSQILSVSSTFVASSVPVNTFNRAEIVDNIYIALFQTDPDSKAAWQGNVKKLKIDGLDTGAPFIRDTSPNAAFATDGRLRFDAVTYWTDPATLLPADPDLNEVPGADGRAIMRGGSGQNTPGFVSGPVEVSGSPGTLNSDGARQLFYDSSGSLVALNADGATATALQGALGAVDATEAEELLKFARGQDIDDLDADTDVTEPRDWLVGDTLHSRPLPLNYGKRGGYSEANPAIYIAVGSNDGYMRLLRNTDSAGAESGEEVWAFMPQAVMGNLKTLRTNAISATHSYMVDGAPVGYLEDTNANGTIDGLENAYLIFGLRRGGRAMYALDVSDPEAPQLLWTIDNNNMDFSELGQTFSTPRIITIYEGGTSRPALAFAGGYDGNKDVNSTDDAMGNAIYVVELDTGALIWKAVGSGAASTSVFPHADLVDSIASPLAILDSDGDGYTDRLYVGDTGGNVWRADIGDSDKSNWKLTLLSRLGRHAPSAGGKVDDRRFFHRADIVQTFKDDVPFDAIIIGSGDRADPRDGLGTVENYTYMIKDTHTGKGTGVDSALEHADLGDVTNTCITEDGACTADLTDGWKLNLTGDGEKQLSAAVTLANTVFFTTYLPGGGAAQGACAPSEGSGRLYAVSLGSATARNNYDSTTEEDERADDLKSAGIPAGVVPIPEDYILRPDGDIDSTGANTRFETYWFEEEDGDL